MGKARRRKEPTQLDKNMDRVRIKHGHIIIDDEVIGDRLDNNEEAHFLHYFLAVNLHTIEHLLVTRYVNKANPE